jgi:hypothetical protein
VAIVEKNKDNVLLIPNEALIRQNGDVYVRLASTQAGQSDLKKISLGMADDVHSEIIAGLNPNDTVIIESKAFSLPKDKTGKNPFMPGRR